MKEEECKNMERKRNNILIERGGERKKEDLCKDIKKRKSGWKLQIETKDKDKD